MFDPFKDAATRGYLRNHAGSSDMEVVKRLEHASFLINIDNAAGELAKLDRPLSYDDILATHKILFSGVYPWAGEDRQNNAPDIVVGRASIMDMFAHPADTRRAGDYALSLGNDKAFMACKPGEVMGALAHAHPFLDGNGRTIMLVHGELAARAGIQVDWQKTEKGIYLRALTAELQEPRKGHLDAYLALFVQRPAERETNRSTNLATLRDMAGLGPAAERQSEIEGGQQPALPRQR